MNLTVQRIQKPISTRGSAISKETVNQTKTAPCPTFSKLYNNNIKYEVQQINMMSNWKTYELLNTPVVTFALDSTQILQSSSKLHLNNQIRFLQIHEKQSLRLVIYVK